MSDDLNNIKKCDREPIKNKSEAIKQLEEDHQDIKLKFEYKTLYLKKLHTGIWFWSKTYYEISYYVREEKKTLKFYSRKGYKTLEYYLLRAFYTGGDEENDDGKMEVQEV